MKTAFRIVGWLLLATLIASVLLVAVGSAWLEPLAHGVIDFDDDGATLSALQGSGWLVAVAAALTVCFAILLALLLVPIALLLPLLVAALAVGIVVFALLGIAALLVSPLLLAVWIAWRLLHDEKPRNAAPAATISA